LNQLRSAAAYKQLGDRKMDVIELCARLMRDEGHEVASRACDVLAAIGPQAADAIPHLISRMEPEVWGAARFTPPRDRPYHPSKCAATLAAIGPAAVPALQVVSAAVPGSSIGRVGQAFI
jgi:hypothetical protein